MGNPTRMLLALLAAFVTVAASPRDGMAKCVERVGIPVLPGYVLVVDGVVVGEYGMDVDPPLPPSAEILRMEVTCLPAERPGGGLARQTAMVVVTHEGAEPLLKTYLRDLAALQQEHHGRTGEYAASADTLNFFATRVPVPLRIDVSRTGWTAEATIEGSKVVCRTGSRRRAPTCSR